MSAWSIIALIIGGIAALFCLALAIFGALVLFAILWSTKKEYEEWKRDQ